MVHVIRLHLHLFIYEQAIWWISDGHEHMQIQSSIDAQKEKTKSGKMKLPMMRRKDFHKLAKHNSIGNLVFQFDQVHSSLTEVHIIRKWHHNYSLTIAIMIHTDELLKPRFHYVYIYIYTHPTINLCKKCHNLRQDTCKPLRKGPTNNSHAWQNGHSAISLRPIHYSLACW